MLIILKCYDIKSQDIVDNCKDKIRYFHSDIVISGEVIHKSKKSILEYDNVSLVEYSVYHIKVEEYFKGNLEDSILYIFDLKEKKVDIGGKYFIFIVSEKSIDFSNDLITKEDSLILKTSFYCESFVLSDYKKNDIYRKLKYKPFLLYRLIKIFDWFLFKYSNYCTKLKKNKILKG